MIWRHSWVACKTAVQPSTGIPLPNSLKKGVRNVQLSDHRGLKDNQENRVGRKIKKSFFLKMLKEKNTS